MKFLKITLLLPLLLLSNLFAQKLNVTVSILPQKYFVEQIAKDKVSINFMVPAGFSPEMYEPKASQMKDLANSSIYFTIGVPFEKIWLEKFKSANKNLNIVDTSKNIKKITIEEHSHDHDNHGDHKLEHSENELDPHIWLDPILVKTQAKTIYETLVKLDSKNSEFYKTNYEQFLKDLDNLHKEIKTILMPLKNRAFMIFHPSFGYFANRFQLEQIAVEVSGKEPKPNQLIKLLQEAKAHNIKIIFSSPEFSQKTADVIAKQINGKVFSISPLKENWSENLIYFAKCIAKSY